MGNLSLAAWLKASRTLGLERLDAQLLLSHHLAQSRAWCLAHDDVPLSQDQRAALDAMRHRRLQGEPLAYLLGSKEFHGLKLSVTPAVLVPRPDTEILVDWALELVAEHHEDAHPAVIDLGTGSGAIALAFAQAHPHARVWATDVSASALEVARVNAQVWAPRVQFFEGHWWQAVPTHSQFDLVLSNPPYIDAADPHMAALHAEPQGALTPGADGLSALREIVAGAHEHLKPQAWVVLEHGWDQGQAVRGLLNAAGFTRVSTRHDLGGQERCTAGCWRGPLSR